MARKFDHWIRPAGAASAARTVVRVMEESIRRALAEKAEQFRQVEAAARCGALFAGDAGASWGEA